MAKRRLVWRIIFVLVLALLILTIRMVDEIGLDRLPDDRFMVVQVLDGDTVELTGGDRLRLIGVDTPERGERWHDEAQSFVERLALNQSVRVVFGKKRRDKYGRMLGFLYVDTILVNRAIIAAGLGNMYLFRGEADLELMSELLSAQKTAIREARGVWSRREHPETEYLSSPGSFRFHRPGCRSISGKNQDRYQIFGSREEAGLIGLSPCRTCRP